MILIDPDGHSYDSTEFLPRLRTSGRPTTDMLLDMAVRKLGFVYVSPLTGGISIRMRPILVSGPAVTELLFKLVDWRPARVVIVQFDDDAQTWRHELCGSWQPTRMRLQAGILGDGRNPTYVATELGPRQLAEAKSGRLRDLLELWRATDGKLGKATLSTIDRMGLLERSAIVRGSSRSDELRIDHFGSKIRLYPDSWNSSAIGRQIEDQPDRIYAQRVTANMRRCAAQIEPLAHRTEAVVESSALKKLQLVYRRLSLPWESPDGSSNFVTTTSVVELHIEVELPETHQSAMSGTIR